MYSLKEYWQLRDLPLPKGEWDGNVICLKTNVEWTFGANETHGRHLPPCRRAFHAQPFNGTQCRPHRLFQRRRTHLARAIA